ncbi:hypothetical protein CLF_110361 [Clonorchis sinensis]|uniref:Uncharacterized protein n=1 Tax=Clonorchis sinensis TaxID=79923 RepID=G7YTG4_CLOSI|nr:hypothetical protein CLF_110361 [Clonorchis sinensis]
MLRIREVVTEKKPANRLGKTFIFFVPKQAEKTGDEISAKEFTVMWNRQPFYSTKRVSKHFANIILLIRKATTSYVEARQLHVRYPVLFLLPGGLRCNFTWRKIWTEQSPCRYASNTANGILCECPYKCSVCNRSQCRTRKPSRRRSQTRRLDRRNSDRQRTLLEMLQESFNSLVNLIVRCRQQVTVTAVFSTLLLASSWTVGTYPRRYRANTHRHEGNKRSDRETVLVRDYHPGLLRSSSKESSLVGLEHVDKIALIVEDQSKAQALLNRLTTIIPSFDMHLAPSKCKVMLQNSLVGLEHVDKIALIVEDQSKAQALLNRLTTIIPSFDMHLAPSKCKVMLQNTNLLVVRQLSVSVNTDVAIFDDDNDDDEPVFPSGVAVNNDDENDGGEDDGTEMVDKSIALKNVAENMQKERRMVSNTIRLSKLAGHLASVPFPLNYANKRYASCSHVRLNVTNEDNFIVLGCDSVHLPHRVIVNRFSSQICTSA